MTELVSIVLPTYNRAQIIGPAMASCLEQTYRNIELIVVDDGSTDDTQSVVRAAAAQDGRLRYLHQENAKLPAALNTGFRAAKGEFLTWTSDDNAYEPNAIELMAGYLREHPEVGLVYCDCQIVNSQDEVVRMSRRRPPTTIGRKNCVGACFMYRRAVAEKVGEYDRDTFLAEDYDYWLRISKVAPLAHMAGIAPYRFRVHAQSLSSLRGAEAELQAAAVRARYARGRRERHNLMAAGHCAAAAELRWVGRNREALRHNVSAIRLAAAAPFTYGNLILTCGWMLLQAMPWDKNAKKSVEESAAVSSWEKKVPILKPGSPITGS